MACRHSLRLGLGIAVAFTWLVWNAPSVRAEGVADLLEQAKQLEKIGDWSKACGFYAYILSKDKDRSQSGVRERFQTCLRHFHRGRRHADSTYRDQVLNQDVNVALKVYGEVLGQLRAEYLDEAKADIQRLFQQGVEELRMALSDEAFCREYLPNTKKESVQFFLVRLSEMWDHQPIRHALEAQSQALRLALFAQKELGIKPTVTVLELACGACNALDEHTFYLTPRQFGEDASTLRGEAVGVGIDIAKSEQHFVIVRVTMNSPAAKSGLMVGERIERIDKKSAAQLTLVQALELLKGKPGSILELRMVATNDSPRVLSLARQANHTSISDIRLIDNEVGVGYIQLASFHENTVMELDEAIRQLEMQGMKSLVLDLRGNTGGLLLSSVKVAERFLPKGAVILFKRGRTSESREISDNTNPLALPVALLVDGTTASAAEVVAGAFKENNRAKLFGQNTFGKGTIQHMVELKTVQSGGIRITWARFYSPHEHRYCSTGIAPDFIVERSSLMFDEPRHAAIEYLLAQQLSMMPR